LDLRVHPEIFEKSGEISIEFRGVFACERIAGLAPRETR